MRIPCLHLAAVIALQIHFQAVLKATACLEISHFHSQHLCPISANRTASSRRPLLIIQPSPCRMGQLEEHT